MHRLFQYALKRIWDLQDALFVKRFGFEFGSAISADELVTEFAQSQLHANGYQGVKYRKLKILLKAARRTGIRFENFIDIGCGTGKACCIAAAEAGFDRIIGIEFSPPLLEIAERNRLLLGDPRIQFHCMDALSYRFPRQTSLVFVFNAFDSTILKGLIAGNLEYFRHYESVIAYAYATDSCRETLSNLGFREIFRQPTYQLSMYALS